MPYPAPPNELIALVGSGCRFAGGASSPSKLWSVLSNAPDLSKQVPRNRFSADGFFHSDPEYHGTTNSPQGYWLEQDHRVFDASFFNITPKEAEAIDPQQRLLLEVVYEALESAGYSLADYAGRNVGVYAGVMTADYQTLSERDELNASQYTSTGTSRAIVANRLSYFFDFHGPSMTIDTACSASLVALHQAVSSLRSREIDMACVAGANLMITPEQFLSESDLHMLSPSGYCRMWDAKADGYARGEGIAAVFIKTLSRALADGDDIQAIIRETGVNSDGRTKGITVPSSEAQRSLIRRTYNKSNLNPLNLEHRPQYFEAHGTGTPVGDPREARAIAEAFFADTNAAHPTPGQHQSPKLLVGSVKTIIGHTEGAAGLAGLLKVVQSMNNRIIPPNMHLDNLNPDVCPFFGNLEVPTQNTQWPQPPPDQPYRASVNSFGFGGTNAHAIIERYEPVIHDSLVALPEPRLELPRSMLSLEDLALGISKTNLPRDSTILLPLLFSATSERSLVANVKKYLDYISRNTLVTSQGLAWHLYNDRTAHPFRTSLAPGSDNSAIETLTSWITKAESSPDTGVMVRSKQLHDDPRILGIFTGQGAQYATMSRGLYQTSAVYRAAIEALDFVLASCDERPKWSLKGQILADEQDSNVSAAEISQPLCTAVQIALVDLLTSIGVSFHCVIGHSSGEIAAAYVAGRLTRRDAILIAYYRGRYAHLAAGTDECKGAMLACGFSMREAELFCSGAGYKGKICVAASNSPTLVTLSGDLDAIVAASHELKSRGTFAKQLNVDTGYHSFHMLKSVEAYSKSLDGCGITPRAATSTTCWVSSVWASREPICAEDLGREYWIKNMVQPVLFHEAVTVALEQCGPFDCAIEVGAHPALKSSAVETMNDVLTTAVPYHGLLHRGKKAGVAFAEFTGFMWSNFGPSSIGIRSLIENSSQPELLNSRLKDAPSYAWDHSQIYLRESRLASQFHSRREPPHELLGVRTRDDNQFELRWRNMLKLDKLQWAEGHKFQGQVLLPASAYCIMALDAAKVVLNGRSASVVELYDLEFLSGITIEPDSLGVETLFTLSIASSGQAVDNQGKGILAEFNLTSVPVTSFNFAPMRKHFQGTMRIHLEVPGLDSLPRRSENVRAETLPVNVDAFYQMMDGVGLSYTGPFKALSSIDRRFNYAMATLGLKHELDSTRLDLSPATLDTCFQSTFATFSSPGDKALWTSFLPTKIGKMQFNLANCGRTASPGMVAVESHLTSFDPFSRTSAATITADLCISDDLGWTMLQVERLTVSSFASTKPKEDHELYLHTVFDLDPEDALVTAPICNESPSPFLTESCERVAQTYAEKNTPFIGIMDTPPLSPKDPNRTSLDFLGEEESSQPASAVPAELLDDFILESPYFHVLELIRETGKLNPEAVPAMLPSVIREAQLLHNFRQHLGRIVQQIAHRYPRMHVLDLTFSQWAFTENILDGLQDSFESYRVPGDPLPLNLSRRCPSLRNNEKVSFADLDIDAQSADVEASPASYDLVVLSTSAFSKFASGHESMLHRIRRLMRHGAFILLVHAPVSQAENKAAGSLLLEQQGNSGAAVTLVPDWSELQDQGKLLPPASDSEQYHAPGLSLVVRQVNKVDMIHPTGLFLGDEVEHEYILIVGKQRSGSVKTLENLKKSLPGRLMTVVSVEKFDDVTPEEATTCTSVLFLADLTRPVCTSMTERALVVLKSLMQPGKAILWITTNARYDPDKAASLGLTRTLKAEVTNLILQVIDFDESDISESLVASHFAQLLQYRGYLTLADGVKKEILTSFEPEIHTDKGKRLIPRVVPYRPAIDRLNAYRRDVVKTYNSLETCVLMDKIHTPERQFQFEARIIKDAGQDLGEEHSGSTFIHVEYSALWPLSIGSSQQQYFSIGKKIQSDVWVAGIATELGSMVPVSEARDLSPYNPYRRNLAALLLPMMLAVTLADWTGNVDIVLLEPDPTFILCLRWVLPASLVTTGRGLHIWTTSSTLAKEDLELKYIHPRSSIRELKHALPQSHPAVIDFHPENNPVSQSLKGLAGTCDYFRWPCPLPRFEQGLSTQVEECGPQWISACNMAMHLSTLQSFPKLSTTFITPAQLLSTKERVPPFAVVDWKTDRLVDLPVHPIVESSLLRPDRTYVLVGLTRDLGQSLCRLFIQHGARSIVVASRNPDKSPAWVWEMNSEGPNIQVQRLDVTSLEDVRSFKARLSLNKAMPAVGGIVNGAMILDDRVFAKMDINTWTRVMRPKTVGSKNLDTVFENELEFFIMTSSFAATGGHAGQSNYAAANMYMNGLAANRRQRGLAGSVLNIGVIYGLGLLAREKQDIYTGLEKDGYPPISERDIHHMFLEAIVAGRPVPGQVMDLTTGLARYRVNDPNPQHWHRDRRFCHYTLDHEAGPQQDSGGKQMIKDLIEHATSIEAISDIIVEHFCQYLESAHQLSGTTGENNIVELGVDSLAAVEIRNWFYKSTGRDVVVMKILSSVSISSLCDEVAKKIGEERP